VGRGKLFGKRLNAARVSSQWRLNAEKLTDEHLPGRHDRLASRHCTGWPEWALDYRHRQSSGQNLNLGFTIASGELIQRVTLPADVAPKGSFIQDLVVDRKRGFVYLADIANPSLLTVNLASGDTWRFQGHASLQPQADARLVINGEAIQFGGAFANVGANPITLSDDRSTVYFGAMNGLDWFSMPACLLREHASDERVADSIVRIGPKPVSDGADTNAAGRHFFTNLNHNGIDVLLPGGSLEPLARDERLSWPDSVRMGPRGWLYVAVKQLHKAPHFTGGKDQGKPPYEYR
jgi:sugar lactone lactonase YvrE